MLGAIVGVLTVLIIAGVGIAVYLLKGAKRNIARERLMELKKLAKPTGVSAIDFEKQQLEESFYDRILHPLLERIASKFKKAPGAAKVDKTADLLMRAGNPGNLTSAQFKALQLLCACIFTIVFLLLGLAMPQKIFAVLFGAVGFGFAFIGPQFWLSSQVTKRRKMMRKQVPDLLDLLTVSVEAGLGFDQATSKVCERMKGPLIDEFSRMLDEQKIGMSRKEALRAMGNRTTIDELDSLISAIIQADTLGVSIGQILRIQSDQLRTKRRQMVEEMAQKLPIKMLFPMIFFIFPTIFIVTLGPIGLKVWKSM